MRGRTTWRWLTLLVAAAAMALAAGCSSTTDNNSDSASAGGDGGGEPASGEKLKVGFVYNGPVNALGWDTALEEGRKAMMEDLGDQVESNYKVAAQGPQIERVLNGYVQDDYDLIFGTSFGQQEFSLPLAKQQPDIKFHQVSVTAEDPNLSGFTVGLEDGYYVMGMAGAALSDSGQLGMVGSFPVPDVLAAVNAFQLGAQAVNPDARVRVVWTNDWSSAAKAQDAAQALINSGAGTLAYMTTGPAPAEIADREGVPWIGFEARHKRFAPDTFLNGVLIDWTPYMKERIQAALDGKWEPSQYYGKYSNGAIKFEGWGPPYEDVPEDVKAKIEETLAGLKDGSFEVFTGPIRDQKGRVRVPEGETMPVEDILSTDWLVQGVIGSAAFE
jgi:basic membrane protein A